jgi:hypothetical protein
VLSSLADLPTGAVVVWTLAIAAAVTTGLQGKQAENS